MPPMNDREREAYRRMKENAYASVQDQEPQFYDVTPEPVSKPNYLSAAMWTSVVAIIVCAVFMGFLLYLYNQINLEENLHKAASHAVLNLERVITQQSNDINKLR